MTNDYPLTIKALRDELEGLDDDAPVHIALVTVADVRRLYEWAERSEEGGRVNLPSARPGVVVQQTTDGGICILAVKHPTRRQGR
jgi:hypothetical protein